MLKITDLSAGYGKKMALTHISASIPSGKITAVLGPNGSGKSTLLKALCRVLPSSGDVTLDGESLFQLPPGLLAQKVSYLSQSHRIPDITVEKLTLHGRFPYLSYPRRYRQQDLFAAMHAMKQMGIDHLADVPLSKLSGGQRQKAYLAMILAQDTPVVLLDEPTTFLDISTQMQMMEQARYLGSLGKTVVMVLHDISQALEYADHIIVINEGCIAASGTPEAVFGSGILDQVFSVCIKRICSNDGWYYHMRQGAKTKSYCTQDTCEQ